jgi:hypothetical protein
LKEYNHIYDDIIISVGTCIEPQRKPLYINRGIFKNPKYRIEDDFPDISMLPHAFSAAAADLELEGLEYMSVAANYIMSGILKKKLKPDDATIGKSNFPPELLKICSIGTPGADTVFLIKINALKNMYFQGQY